MFYHIYVDGMQEGSCLCGTLNPARITKLFLATALALAFMLASADPYWVAAGS